MDELEISEQLAGKLENLPTKPGVYQYFNSEGKIIYVGKAKNLRNRVRSYFQRGRPMDAKTKALVGKIADLELITVDNEAEALLLEDTLIKKHKPRYNVLLRDDKSYPYVRVTNEPYPRIFPTRKIIRDGSKYYGPFTEVRNLRQVMRALRSVFMIRGCKLNINDDSIRLKKHRVCLDFHIHKCEGPCEGLIPEIHYNQKIKQAVQVLNGKTREIEKIFEEEMLRLSEEMKFEEAAQMRNRLMVLKDYSSKQKMVSSDLIDRDVFGIARLDDTAATLVLKIRDGKLIGKRNFIVKNSLENSDESIVQRTIEKWYLESEFVPKEIFLPNEPEDLEYITDWLGKMSGRTINIAIPKLGDKRKLVEMAGANAELILKEYNAAMEKRDQVIPRPVLSLQRDLRMKNPPRIIECFDNSHIQGSELVSSMVYFEDGKPKKSEYRKFKNKTVGHNDDFAAMREVVHRRYSRLIEEKKQLPDLIIIDGGKGQLSSAFGVITELGIAEKVTIVGLAKRLEEVYFPGVSDSILMPRSSSSLKLIQQVRDEAHRFAITFHRSLRSKRTLHTELTEIKGIGEKTAQKLLIEFGSVEGIKAADDETIEKLGGKKTLKLVRDYFNHDSESMDKS